MAENKSRAQALKALSGAEPAVDAPKVDVKSRFEGVEAVEFGGTVRVGVLFDIYRVHVDGVWKDATKGQVVKVDAKVADRGESLGGLVRL